MSHFLRVNIQTPSMRHFCDVPNYTALLRDIVNEYGHTFGGGELWVATGTFQWQRGALARGICPVR